MHEKDTKLHAIDYSPYFAPAAAVETFMTACGHLPVNQLPHERGFDLDMVRLYFKFVNEEHKELKEAFDLYDQAILGGDTELMYKAVAEILDGSHDLIWVTLGLLLASGFPIQAGWHEVASSNLAKIDSRIGQVRKREDGKILKPEGWKPPDFMKLIRAHLDKKLVT